MVLFFFSDLIDIIIQESNKSFNFYQMNQTLEQLVGQLIIAGFRGTEASPNSSIAKYIQEYNLAGVILYDEDVKIGGLGSRNIQSPEQLKNLTGQLQSFSTDGLLISIDQEGGSVDRLKLEYGFPETPSWNHMGHRDNDLMTKQFSQSIASTLSDCGINLNFAPVMDLHYGEETVIGKTGRAHSPHPKSVVQHCRIFVQSMKENQVISCGKHFPGQGSASGDTHKGLTDISDSWTVKDLLPFDEMIQSDDLDMIMVSHTFDSKMDLNYPSSLSRKIITNMLRNDMGFDGVVICDDPSMNAISDHYDLDESFELMLNAGIDLFCLGNNLNYDPDFIPNSVEAMVSLVNNKKVLENRIQESIERINQLKSNYNIHG
jgi:beta-N-acetylhexosaminidase